MLGISLFMALAVPTQSAVQPRAVTVAVARARIISAARISFNTPGQAPVGSTRSGGVLNFQ